MFLKRSGRAIVLLPLFLAAGCSSTMDSVSNGISGMFSSDANAPVKVESNPSGADVYVMGEKVGVTPLKIEQKTLFPLNYPKEKESLYGKITLKKSGCQDYVKGVNAKILKVGIKARMDCGDLNPQSAEGSYGGSVKAVPRMSESIEQRLAHIKELQEKGLITEDEAKKARDHVLNDL